MYCRNCGETIDDKAVICPICGVQTGSLSGRRNDENIIALIGFVLAFLMPIAGLICSVIGYKAAKKDNLPYGGLALAGIIVSCTLIVLIVVYVLIVVIALSALLSQLNLYYYL